MKLKVSPEEALRLLNRLEHETFQEALKTHWEVEPDGHVWATSVCWLFCWGKTGMGNEDAAEAAREIFDAIMDKPFAYCDKRIPHDDFARKYRYKENTQDIENNLAVRLGEIPYPMRKK